MNYLINELLLYRPQQVEAQMIAHRGYSGNYPENTLLSFKKAIEEGVDFIEFDVQLTRDGIPVVIHDETTLRTTDSLFPYRVSRLTYKELQNFDCGKWRYGNDGSSFPPMRIPTLAEVLELDFKTTGLMIELKQDDTSSNDFVLAVKDLIKSSMEHFQKDKLRIGSFSADIIHSLKSYFPVDCLCGILEKEQMIAVFHDMGVSHLVIDYHILNEKLVKETIDSGVSIWSYTVEDPLIAQKLITMGVSGLISNSIMSAKFAQPSIAAEIFNNLIERSSLTLEAGSI